MSTKKTTSRPTPPTYAQPSAQHRLNALLHTMRSIAQYDDVLCELTHEVDRKGALTPEAADELHLLLEKIPAHDFVLDLEAVRAILTEPRPAAKAAPKKSTKSTAASRGPAARKRAGRKSSK